jgi:hypothetical protein
MSHNKTYSNFPYLLLIVIWTLGVGGGFWALIGYQYQSQGNLLAKSLWPEDTMLERNRGGPTLLLFFHPRCPCSQATLSEFERMQRHLSSKAKVFMLFIQASGTGESWVQTNLWRRARRLLQVVVKRDAGGQEAYRFGARCSGQALLFNGAGELVFSGGLTASRSHEGHNYGVSKLLNAIDRTPGKRVQFPVFGCPLFSSKDLDQLERSCRIK